MDWKERQKLYFEKKTTSPLVKCIKCNDIYTPREPRRHNVEVHDRDKKVHTTLKKRNGVYECTICIDKNNS